MLLMSHRELLLVVLLRLLSLLVLHVSDTVLRLLLHVSGRLDKLTGHSHHARGRWWHPHGILHPARILLLLLLILLLLILLVLVLLLLLLLVVLLLHSRRGRRHSTRWKPRHGY